VELSYNFRMRAGWVKHGTDDAMVYPNHRGFSQLGKGDYSYSSVLKLLGAKSRTVLARPSCIGGAAREGRVGAGA